MHFFNQHAEQRFFISALTSYLILLLRILGTIGVKLQFPSPFLHCRIFDGDFSSECFPTVDFEHFEMNRRQNSQEVPYLRFMAGGDTVAHTQHIVFDTVI